MEAFAAAFAAALDPAVARATTRTGDHATGDHSSSRNPGGPAGKGRQQVAYWRMRVLVLNPGSSSLKSSVIETASIPVAGPDGIVPAAGAAALAPLAEVGVDWGVDATSDSNPAGDIQDLVARYEASGIAAESLGAVGYRVVHGGATIPRVDARHSRSRGAGERADSDLAPLHNGVAAATMTAGMTAIPHLPHVAVFDTAFHATLPEDAFRYPVPERWYREWGVRRYGFHGVSVAWSSGTRRRRSWCRPVSALRIVVAHLGSGCSVTAVDGGSLCGDVDGPDPAGRPDEMGTLLRLDRPRNPFLSAANGAPEPRGAMADQVDHGVGFGRRLGPDLGRAGVAAAGGRG